MDSLVFFETINFFTTIQLFQMNRLNNTLYIEDIQFISNLDLPWNELHNSSIVVSGATGLIGTFLIDVLMYKNIKGLNCKIYAIGRNRQRAETCFSKWLDSDLIEIKSLDVNKSLPHEVFEKAEYILHLASNTHPIQYATDPIGTISTNVIGLKNMLELSVEKKSRKFLFTSSVEIYGENRGDIELFDEKYCGYIDSNSLRAGYPESKRCGESLCQAYQSQQGLNINIGRVARSYGPTMSFHDSRAISQFIIKGIKKDDIVLKSTGNQLFSYTYVADAVSGLLTILLKGSSGEAYNIADESSNVTLKYLAHIIAEHVGTNVVFDLPDAVEAAGFSKAMKALMDGSKLKRIGWVPKYSIAEGVVRTIEILKDDFLLL